VMTPTYNGEDYPNISAFAHERPLDLSGFNPTTGHPPWEAVKRYRMRAVKVILTMPISVSKEDRGKGASTEMFVGWNKTPADKLGHTVSTETGYLEFRSRCDKRVIDQFGSRIEVTLHLKNTPWLEYVPTALYSKYKDLYDQQLDTHANGSILFGFYGLGTTLTKIDVANMVRLECVLDMQFSKNIGA